MTNTSDRSFSAAATQARDESHNSEINTAAAGAHRCGMTHLASGRLCLLPERHAGGCDFRAADEAERVITDS
jgi:hypothetical protein